MTTAQQTKTARTVSYPVRQQFSRCSSRSGCVQRVQSRQHRNGQGRHLLVFLSLIISASALAAEKPLSVPSDSKAQFFVLEKGGKGAERTIVTKRVGPSGTSFSKRLYNCTGSTVKYLGTGDSLAEMASSRADPKMGPIVQGSIAYYVGVEACK